MVIFQIASIALQQGLKDYDMSLIASQLNIDSQSMSSLYPDFPTFLKHFFKAVNHQAIQEINTSAPSSKDDLIDFMMTRFEIMNPYKHSLKNITTEILYTPSIWKDFLHLFDPFQGFLETKTLESVFIHVIYIRLALIWGDDTSKDLSITLAEADRIASIIWPIYCPTH